MNHDARTMSIARLETMPENPDQTYGSTRWVCRLADCRFSLMLLATVLAAAVLSASCQGKARQVAPLPRNPEVVNVVMREYGFDYRGGNDRTVRRGRIVFRTRNIGKLEHDLVIVGLPKDLPGTLAEQLRSPNRRAGRTLAHQDPRPPGTGGFFAVDLPAGRYGLICFVRDPDGENHALKGMAGEFRVR